MKIFRKLSSSLIGFIFVLICFEIFLRSIYLYQNFEVKTLLEPTKMGQIVENKFNILMLGNSHTAGVGVTKQDAYPDVLQRFFEKNLQNSKLKVNIYNGGMPNSNNFQIYNALDKLILKSEPNIAIIMAGEPNIWNKFGYNEFVKIKYNFDTTDMSRIFQSLAQYSKFVKWLIQISGMIEANQISQDEQYELLIYKEIQNYELNLKDFHFTDKEFIKEKLIAFRTFVEKRRNFPHQGNWRAILNILAKLEIVVTNQHMVALGYINESINSNPAVFDIGSYYFLSNYLMNASLPQNLADEANKLLNNIKMNESFPGEQKIKLISDFSSLGQRHFDIEKSDGLAFIQQCHEILPFFSFPTDILSQYYQLRIQDIQKSNQFVIDTVKLNPFTKRANLSSKIVKIASQENRDVSTRKQALEFIEEFNKKFPSEKHIFDPDQDNKLYSWIFWDMENIINKFESKKIRLVVQNYHWLMNRNQEALLNKVNLDVASSHNVPFLDLNSEFKKNVQNSNDIGSFYSKKLGPNDLHPSEKGHKLIAYIMYKKLVQQKLLPEEISHFDAEEILK